MTPDELKALAASFGFTQAYCLRPQPLEEAWRAQCKVYPPPHTGKLCLNPKEEFPFASSIVLLVKAYGPFPAESGLPGYYIASNAGYHAAKAFCEALGMRGFRAQRLEVPLSALVELSGIGRLLKNALIDVAALGTRTVLFTVATDACPPEDALPAQPPACGSCNICVSRCPAGAIGQEQGLQAGRCIRAHMETGELPGWVMERMTGLLGCEICMDCCPRNRAAGVAEPAQEVKAAFDFKKLLQGDIASARALVGKNMCTGGRLIAHAAVLAAKAHAHDLRPEIERLLKDERQPVRSAAAWALEELSRNARFSGVN